LNLTFYELLSSFADEMVICVIRIDLKEEEEEKMERGKIEISNKMRKRKT
jgi:hypothetical protein